MTEKEALAYLNRINTQLTALADRYGVDSQVYKDVTAIFTKIDDRGVNPFEGIAEQRLDHSWKIKRSKKVVGTKAFNILLKKDFTLTGVEGGAKGTKEERKQQTEMRHRIRGRFEKVISKIYSSMTDNEVSEFAPELAKKGKKSYEELEKLTRKYNMKLRRLKKSPMGKTVRTEPKAKRIKRR